jgi:hypothetical protein
MKPPGRGIGLFIARNGKGDLVARSKHFPAGERWDVELGITDKAIKLKVADVSLSKAKESVVACRPIISCGAVGNTFYKLVLEGTLDDAWVKQHFADKK